MVCVIICLNRNYDIGDIGDNWKSWYGFDFYYKTDKNGEWTTWRHGYGKNSSIQNKINRKYKKECLNCKKVFKSALGYKNHIERERQRDVYGWGNITNYPHACDGCSKRFLTKKDCRDHMRRCGRVSLRKQRQRLTLNKIKFRKE